MNVTLCNLPSQNDNALMLSFTFLSLCCHVVIKRHKLECMFVHVDFCVCTHKGPFGMYVEQWDVTRQTDIQQQDCCNKTVCLERDSTWSNHDIGVNPLNDRGFMPASFNKGFLSVSTLPDPVFSMVILLV